MKSLCALALAAVVLSGATRTPAAQPDKPTLFIIGDSTVKNSTKGQQGWGEVMAAHFDTNKINLANHAIGGRSSRTFLTEGRWARVLAELKTGDFVLIQFGHNDGGAPDDRQRPRGSLRGTGEETREIKHPQTGSNEVVHTYGWYLRQYVTWAKAKGATPIVCSLVPRNIWKEGRVTRASGSFAAWAAGVAKAEKVPFIDLNELVAARYEQLGEEKTKGLFFGDHTHTSPEGARLNAAIVAEALQALPGHPLGPFLPGRANSH